MCDEYQYFGFRKGDPFLACPRFKWSGLNRIVNRLKRAARQREWMLFYGPPGSGKTEALNEFAETYGEDCHLAWLRCAERKYVSPNSILEAFALDLDLPELGEKLARSRETRVRQIVRLLGVRCREKPVMLIMDEANSFILEIFNAVKFMRDQLWAGRPDKSDRRPHFGVVMFGWATLAKRVGGTRQNEIRVRRYEQTKMSRAEMADFLDHVGFTAGKLPDESRDILWQRARYPGEIRYTLQGAMQRAADRGRKVITPDDLKADVELIAQTVKRLGIRQNQIAKKCGLSTTVVCQVLAESYSGAESTRNKVLTACERLIRDDDDYQASRRPERRRTA